MTKESAPTSKDEAPLGETLSHMRYANTWPASDRGRAMKHPIASDSSHHSHRNEAAV
jgi:hypothetical protein